MLTMRTHGAYAKRSFGTVDMIRSESLTVPLTTRVARRFLEQQPEEPPIRESRQEWNREPEQQQRVPSRRTLLCQNW